MVFISAVSLCKAQDRLGPDAEPALSWTEFRSEEGRFSVQFPGKPEFESLTLTTKQGRVVANTVKVDTAAFTWLVTYLDLPQNADLSNPERVFNEARDQLLRATKATLQHQNSLTLDTYAGSEIILRFSGGQARVRYFLVRTRLYEVAVTRLDLLSLSQESIERFLRSFRLINGEQLEKAARISSSRLSGNILRVSSGRFQPIRGWNVAWERCC